MNFRRSLALAAALGLTGSTAWAQHAGTGSHPIPTANNPLSQGVGFGTGYNNPLSQGVGFGTGYNNPISQGVGFGTGYNDPLNQGAGFGTGYNNPLQQNGTVNAMKAANVSRQSAATANTANTGTGFAGYTGGATTFGGGGFGTPIGAVGGNQGYGFGGWGYNNNQGFGFGSGYYDPLMMQGAMNGNVGNSSLIPDGLNPAGVGNIPGRAKSNAAVSAALNGSIRSKKVTTHSRSSKSSKSSKRTTRR